MVKKKKRLSVTKSRRKPDVQNEKNVYVAEGLITESLPNGMFRVCLEPPNMNVILGYICGTIRINKIKIIPGDRVQIHVSKVDGTKGRITKRLT